jgi:Domain of unknown function (DUF4203)
MGLFVILVGFTLLTLGRQLFWLFVGCVGFAIGFTYTQALSGIQSDVTNLIVAILIGLAGALLAVFLQGVAIALSGFAAGLYITMHIVQILGLGTGQLGWLPCVVGGVAGAVALVFLFDWALIFLSSLVGSVLIVRMTQFGSATENLLFTALVIFGIFFQRRLLRPGRSSEKGS